MVKLQFHEYTIRSNAMEYQILIPALPLLQTCLLNVDKMDFMLFSNQADLKKLSAMFTLASQKKDTLLYLPIKHNNVDSSLEKQFGREGQDMVILHHQLQFPLKVWKTLRSNCKSNKLVSYEIDEKDSIGELKEYDKDHLLLKNQFDTLFMVGSTSVFQCLAIECKEVAQEGPTAWEKGFQYHVHLNRYIRSRERQMCINFFLCE